MNNPINVHQANKKKTGLNNQTQLALKLIVLQTFKTYINIENFNKK